VTRTNTQRCPTCGSRTVPIIYGMPCDPKLIKKAERGDVELGGCVIWFDNPSKVCRGSEPHYLLEGEAGALVAIPEE
jgi:hypothetical protein